MSTFGVLNTCFKEFHLIRTLKPNAYEVLNRKITRQEIVITKISKSKDKSSIERSFLVQYKE